MTASVSALSSQGQAISVISDNLANTNTVGYKAGRSLFSQLVTSAGASGTTYNAGGVSANIQRNENSQGSLVSSSNTTDLAISGTGFFRVADNSLNNSDTSYYYTRAGDFSQNKEGFLVNSSGFFLQGWRTDADGNILNVQTPVAVELGSVGVSSQETKTLGLNANLNSTIGVNAIYNDTTSSLSAVLQTVIADPTKADFLADVRVFDAQGGARDMTIAFTKRAANLWDFQVYTDGSNVQGGTPGVNSRIGNIGTLQFNTTGTLESVTGTSLPVTWAGGVNPSNITLSFGDFTGGLVVNVPATATAPTGAPPAGGVGALGYTGTSAAGGVLGISFEGSPLTAGNYTLRYTGNPGEYQLGTGTGAGFVATADAPVTIGANGVREIYFSTSKVRITVGNSFDEAPAGGVTDLTFTATQQAALNSGVGTNGVIQFSANSNVSSVNQDGFGAGTLASVQVDESGFVNGTFTNGETKKLYRLAIGIFQNPNGLEPLSGNLLRVTDASGQALLKQPNLGGTGRIVGGSLEGSTTDIAGEFSQMIIAQRAFQASSSVISTVDQMLNNLLQIR
ncbi:MAG TPA: flagellar hook-basal body complex protein [Alphaproteobacteria bacterium]|nr:flagellar hook-basal body complex protein [Alphaproteobacteria bacterium]